VQLTEQEYWQLISEGDKSAFEQVFKAWYQPLCNYACSLMKDMDEAEEVVQNVFFNIWNKRESLAINMSIKSYLYRAVHNDCLNKIKHSKVRTLYAEDYKSRNSGGFEDSMGLIDAKELNKRINEAIESLPEQCGIVFRLSRFDHLKYSEIAEQLEISVKTVENHMGKALRILRESLKEYLPVGLLLFFLIR
jgi:RNA polymerase sigma-70 factor (family 1)